MAKTVLELKNVNKTFGKRKVIDNISLDVKEGEIYGFLGPNGSGKTTTIKMILRMIDLDSGEIRVNGYDTKKEFEKAMECIGAIVENPDMYKYMSGIDNLKLHARIRNIDQKRIQEVLELVELKDRAKDKVGKYSLGMKQRLGLALTLLHKPKVLILDEPTNGLDPAGIKKLRDILKEISHKKGVAVFVSSHILSELGEICTRIGIIKNGSLVCEGTVEEVMLMASGTAPINITVMDKVEEAIALLKEKAEIKEISVDGNKITINLAGGDKEAKDILKDLVLKDIPVISYSKSAGNLEEVFIQITEEDN